MPPHDTINHLQQVMGHEGEQAFQTVPLILAKVIRKELWRNRKDQNGQPFTSFESFVAHKLWWGLESSIDDLLAYCRKDEATRRLVLAAADRAMTMEEAGAKGGRGKKADSNTTSFNRGATYSLKRLKRDRPDLADKVIAGELSANAAAIEAGFRKKTITIPDDPVAITKALVRRFGVLDALRLADAIEHEATGRPVTAEFFLYGKDD